MYNEDLQRLKEILFEVLERKKDEISENSWQAVTEISKVILQIEQAKHISISSSYLKKEEFKAFISEFKDMFAQFVSDFGLMDSNMQAKFDAMESTC